MAGGAAFGRSTNAGRNRSRILISLEHAIQDASLTRSGERRVISRQMLYVEIDAEGTSRHLHYAPYLDYRPLFEGEPDDERELRFFGIAGACGRTVVTRAEKDCDRRMFMKPKITTLTVERFRALRKLKIDGLGRVNLITGRNNTGKSSVLEALRILASDGSPAVIVDILRLREEGIAEGDEQDQPLDEDGFFLLSNLHNGFPKFSAKLDPIVITASGEWRSMKLIMKTEWLSEERSLDGIRRVTPKQQELFSESETISGLAIAESETIPGLAINVNGVKRNIPLNLLQRYANRGRVFRPDYGDEPKLPCVFVSPYGGERTATLGALWDKIALSDREKHVIEALRIIDPQIEAVSMVGGEKPRIQRTAIVRSRGIVRPVSLRSFGDGLNRLFGIVLSLVNAKDGLLLIDEFENGMHHSVQLDVWRAVFELSRQLDIQVFATSHSWDSVEAFQKAAAETPEEGVLVRLSHLGEEIVSTVFAEDELAIATRDRIEVR